jgi:hypothetical protein
MNQISAVSQMDMNNGTSIGNFGSPSRRRQAWPWRNSGVASIRKSFLLPTDRPLPG